MPILRAPDGFRLSGIWTARYRDVRTGRTWRGGVYRNVVCLNGSSVIAAWLNAEAPALSYWGAVGTGTSAPVNTDTQLGAELGRVQLASSSRGTNIVLLDFFFNTGQGNGALTEAGCFLSANAGVNSGQLLSHVAISENKTTGVTLTLEFQLTIS